MITEERKAQLTSKRFKRTSANFYTHITELVNRTDIPVKEYIAMSLINSGRVNQLWSTLCVIPYLNQDITKAQLIEELNFVMGITEDVKPIVSTPKCKDLTPANKIVEIPTMHPSLVSSSPNSVPKLNHPFAKTDYDSMLEDSFVVKKLFVERLHKTYKYNKENYTFPLFSWNQVGLYTPEFGLALQAEFNKRIVERSLERSLEWEKEWVKILDELLLEKQ